MLNKSKKGTYSRANYIAMVHMAFEGQGIQRKIEKGERYWKGREQYGIYRPLLKNKGYLILRRN